MNLFRKKYFNVIMIQNFNNTIPALIFSCSLKFWDITTFKKESSALF